MRAEHNLSLPSEFKKKLKRHRAFWDGSSVDRPMIGFSLGGWFPLLNYPAMRKFRHQEEINPDHLVPGDLLEDYDRMVAQWEGIEDDLIRAVAPIPPFPWMEAMLGQPVRVGDEAIWAEEGGFDYSQLGDLDFSENNPWRQKYLECVRTLKDHFGDLCPVGQPILRGVSDMIAALRGSSQMILDLYDHPKEYRILARPCADLLLGLVKEQQTISGPFAGGYVLEQFSLWAPNPVVRLQEDASGLFSPDFYANYLLEEDRRLAAAFPYSLIHLHASSLFLLDRILEIEDLDCIQINKDVGDVTIESELPSFKKVQAHGRKLLIRGKLDRDDLFILRKHLSPNGLYLQIVVETTEEALSLYDFFVPWS